MKLPCIIANAVPKAGTNLLKNLLLAIPGVHASGYRFVNGVHESSDDFVLDRIKDSLTKRSHGIMYHGHIAYHDQYHSFFEGENFRHIFMFRDPRDIVVSLRNYIINPKRDGTFHAYKKYLELFDSEDDQIMGCIQGFKANDGFVWRDIGFTMSSFFGWVNQPEVLCLRYEDLCPTSPIREVVIQRILNHLRFHPSTSETIDEICETGMTTDESITFRKGQAGTWREKFNKEHKEAFRTVCGKIHHAYGYFLE
jgi:hypothetical protein